MSARKWTPEQKRENQRIRQRIWRELNPDKVKQQIINRYAATETEVAVTIPDLLVGILPVTFTKDQLHYLKTHRKEKRTSLARNLGIMKVQLNYMLDRKIERRRKIHC